MQQKTTKTDSLVPCIEVMQGWITGWSVVWIGRGERVNHRQLRTIAQLMLLNGVNCLRVVYTNYNCSCMYLVYVHH